MLPTVSRQSIVSHIYRLTFIDRRSLRKIWRHTRVFTETQIFLVLPMYPKSPFVSYPPRQPFTFLNERFNWINILIRIQEFQYMEFGANHGGRRVPSTTGDRYSQPVQVKRYKNKTLGITERLSILKRCRRRCVHGCETRTISNHDNVSFLTFASTHRWPFFFEHVSAAFFVPKDVFQLYSANRLIIAYTPVHRFESLRRTRASSPNIDKGPSNYTYTPMPVQRVCVRLPLSLFFVLPHF